MKQLRNFRYLTVVLIGLALSVLLFGCGSPPLIQPEGVTPPDQPKTTPSPIATTVLKNEAESVSQSPLPTPTFSATTNTPAPITSPTSVSPSPPSTTPDMRTTKTISGFQVTEASVKTESLEEAQFVLPITLNRAKLQPSVQELVYVTTDPLDDQLAETTIWRVNTEDITHPTPIITMPHLKQSPVVHNPALSPDGQYLVYGQELDDNTGIWLVWLLNINEGTQQTIDKGSIVPRADSPIFFWAADSRSIVYSKDFESSISSEIHQYSIETGEIRVHLVENGFIRLVGQNRPLIYYFLQTFSGPSYPVKSLDLVTNQTQEILAVEGAYVNKNVKMSPDGRRVLFNSVLVDLQTKMQTPLYLPLFSYEQLLWLPDGQGFLGAEPLSTLQFTATDHQVGDQEEKTELTFQAPVDIERSDWISWSPDGQYLIYRTKSSNHQSSYHLLDVFSGQTQPFPATDIFQIGGWLTTP